MTFFLLPFLSFSLTPLHNFPLYQHVPHRGPAAAAAVPTASQPPPGDSSAALENKIRDGVIPLPAAHTSLISSFYAMENAAPLIPGHGVKGVRIYGD